jgi:hypothetical protein
MRSTANCTDLFSYKVISSGLARTAVLDNFEANFLAFNQRRQASALDSRDVNEYIVCAVVRLNETIAFGGVEEFYCSSGHNDFLSIGHEGVLAMR